MRLFLSGGPAELERQSHVYDLMSADPELKNYVEFSELTPHEAQRDHWRRLKVLYEKHNDLFFGQSKAEGVDWVTYFQG